MKLLGKLNKIQQELKAPKNQFNSFGNYNYRSCEDITEAVKPLLDGAVLILSDEVVNIGNHNYVVAHAEIREGEEKIGVQGMAREAVTKKGMDDAQITGACSSYARKYALNGLFAIDDTKDADTMDNQTQNSPKKATQASYSNSTQNNDAPVGTTQNAINRAKNYSKPEDDDKEWITEELFKDAIKKCVEAGTVKLGTEPKEVMRILRMKYKVAKKYEAMVDDEINSNVIK